MLLICWTGKQLQHAIQIDEPANKLQTKWMDIGTQVKTLVGNVEWVGDDGGGSSVGDATRSVY